MTDVEERPPMEFEGDPLAGSTLKISVEQAVLPLHAGDRVAVLAKGVVRDVAFPKKKDGRIRVHVAKADDAVVVDEGLADDIIGMHRELVTGQMQLLSADGEARMAARLVLDERQSDGSPANELAVEDLGAAIEGNELWKISPPGEDAGFDEYQEFYESFIEGLTVTGAVVLRGIEWARAELGNVVEARRKDALEKTARRGDEDGNVAVPSEVCPGCGELGSVVEDPESGLDECVECGATFEPLEEAEPEPEPAKPEGYHQGLVAVVGVLNDQGAMSSAAIAGETQLSVSRVRDVLRELREAGAVDQAPGRTYEIVDPGAAEHLIARSEARP